MGQDTLKRLLTARVVRTPPKMTEDEQLYRDLVNIRPEGKSRGVGKDGEPLPPVPDAPGFRPQPLVTGTDPDFLSSVNRIMRIAPEMNDASRLAEIRHGHTKGSMERHINSKMAPDMFGLTNLLGLFDRRDKTIGISPNAVRNLPPYNKKNFGDDFVSDPYDMDETVGHEVSHAAGYSEDKAGPLGLLLAQSASKTHPKMGLSRKILSLLLERNNEIEGKK